MSEEEKPTFDPYIQFKTPHVASRATLLCETAITLMNCMAEWCKGAGLPFIVTDTVSTIEEDRALKRVSETHRTARAFDVSRKGWLQKAIDDFTAHFEKEWGAMGATGFQAGTKELIVHHEIAGEGDHMHVQLSRAFAIKDAVPPSMV
jgi:hypothetical protein